MILLFSKNPCLYFGELIIKSLKSLNILVSHVMWALNILRALVFEYETKKKGSERKEISFSAIWLHNHYYQNRIIRVYGQSEIHANILNSMLAFILDCHTPLNKCILPWILFLPFNIWCHLLLLHIWMLLIWFYYNNQNLFYW